MGQTGLGNGMPRQCLFQNDLTSQNTRKVETIHQFHPLIRFIGRQLGKNDEAFYPVVAVRLPRDAAVDLAPGDYMFALRRWSFSGVREEEWLQSAVCRLELKEPIPDEQAESLINAARVHGVDWIEAHQVVSSNMAVSCLDRLEEHLDEAYQRARRRKQDENADRTMFQLYGIDQNLQRRLTTLEFVRDEHSRQGRQGLVRATQGRIDKLIAAMELKREHVRRKENLQPDDAPVCAGLIRIS